MKLSRICQTPIGLLTLVEDDGALCEVRFGSRTEGTSPGDTPLLLQAERELNEYFAAKRRTFTVPLKPTGTPFQLRCLQALCTIPYGEVRTYGWQAAQAGSPRACRAAGMSNHRNPLPIFIPCHRVVGTDGKLTGYAGGIGIKQTLLDLERMKRS